MYKNNIDTIDMITINDELINDFYAVEEGFGYLFRNDVYIFRLYGKDVLDYLHRLSTNSLSDLPVNRAKRTVFTDMKGRIIDSVLVVNLSDFVMLIGSIDKKEKMLNWLNKYLITEDVTIKDISNFQQVIQVLGKKINNILKNNFVLDFAATEELKILFFEINNSFFSIIDVKKFADYDSYLIISETQHSEVLINRFREIKKEYDLSGRGIKIYEISRGFYDYVRISNLITSCKEYSEEFNPNELNLLDEIDFNKGCYIGQEVIARLETYQKVQKQKVIVEFVEKNIQGEEFQILDEKGGKIGNITSVAPSLYSDKKIGFAILRKGYIQLNRILEVTSVDSETVSSYQVRIVKTED